MIVEYTSPEYPIPHESHIPPAARVAAEDWYRAAARLVLGGVSGRLWLYFKRRNGDMPGRLVFTTNTPDGDGWELVTPEAISPAQTKDQTATQIYDILQKLPIL